MSELIQNKTQHFSNLRAYCHGVTEGKNGKALYDTYRSDIEIVTASEAMRLLDDLLLNFPFEKVKEVVGKLINIFYKSLSSREWEKPGEGHFLHMLMLENREAEKIIHGIRSQVKVLYGKEVAVAGNPVRVMQSLISRLKEYELHYIKKENILFPYLESAFPEYRCLQLMWSFHDDFRRSVKLLGEMLEEEKPDMEHLNKEIGKLFFVVLPVIFREEQIVFPVAFRAIPGTLWQEMLVQAKEIGWCYIQPPDVMKSDIQRQLSPAGLTDLMTGELSREQIILMLEALPVDITFVDEDDTVRYFSGSRHRIFPRSKAIIGRKVQNCHPPESVHIVNRIIEAFRNGEKDHADFWIALKGRFIHIRYFAMRSESGAYKGTIEVSQDVTGIRALEGERRLPDWGDV